MHGRNGLTPRNDARLNLLAESMHLVVFNLGADARLRDPQPAWETYTGQSWSNARERGFLSAVHEQDRRALCDRLQTRMRERQPFEASARVYCAWAEQHRLCSWSFAPAGAPGPVDEWVVALRDRACESWREEAWALQRAIEEEERVVQSLQTLVSGFSHVINNALQGALLSTECAARDAREKSAWLIRIEESIERIAVHCAGLHLLTGLSYEEVESCDLAELVRGVEERLRPLPAQVSELHCEAMPGCVVRGNHALLVHAFDALLQNALESLPASGGVVRVTATTAHMEREELTGARPHRNLRSGPWAYVEVCDNGSGIAPALQPRVFQPLFSTKFKGRGLGLATVAQLARRWGGLVLVRGMEGGGTCVRFLLPCERACAGQVLVVAEDPAESLLARVALEGGAYAPLLAGSVEEARELSRKRAIKPDALVLDLAVEGGLEFARELSAEYGSLGVVVAVASATEARCCPNDARYIAVRKPWRDPELVQAVQQARAVAEPRRTSEIAERTS